MKTTRLRFILLTCGILAVFAAGFFFGGIYASISAARSANAASLVYFTGIHDALDHQKYDQAASITNTAVDGHIAVLHLLDTHPWMAFTYVSPWMRAQDSWITTTGLSRVRKSYEAQPDKLRPETRDFLAASR